MGQFFIRMATLWLEEQTSDKNRLQSTMFKRKRTDSDDDQSNKRTMMTRQQRMKHSSDNEDERIILSPRIAPILSKINRSSTSMTLFRCQLCRRYLKTKDHYMEHMIACAIQCQASIKIVRSNKEDDEEVVS